MTYGVSTLPSGRTCSSPRARPAAPGACSPRKRDETLSDTDEINNNIREILDVQTEEWGIKVNVVELKDIQLPETMQRAMARQAEAEREKRAKIIAAQGEALAAGVLERASDEMMAHPLALQLRNLQTTQPTDRTPRARTRG